MPKYVLKSFLAGFFSVTFTVSPFAMAASQTEIDKVKALIQTYPVNGKKTYLNFYSDLVKKNPKADKVLLKHIARTFGADKIPHAQTQEFKYKGKPALKIITTINKQSLVVELLNNGNEVLKIDGVMFTKADTANHKAFDAKLRTIPAVAKIYHGFQQKVFSKSHKPTKEQWAKLTPGQRAEYYLRFRQLLEASYKVHNSPGFKVTSNDNKSFEQWAQEMFLGSEAQADMAVIGGPRTPRAEQPAATAAPTSGRSDATVAEKAEDLRNTIQYNKGAEFRKSTETGGPSCIVAGYAMEWDRSNMTCPWNGGKGNADFYEKFPLSKECKEVGANHIACNPVIYGFNESGKPHCINSADKSTFNFATHGNGPCEKASPLKNADDQKKFLSGILKRAKIKDDQLEVRNGVLYSKNSDLHAKVMKELKDPLLAYIKSAEKICDPSERDAQGKVTKYTYSDEARVKVGIKAGDDRAYQNEACDGLLKRAVALENLLQMSPEVQIAKPCEGWSPEGSYEVIPGVNGGPATCGCKNKIAPTAAEPKCCLDTTPIPPVVADTPIEEDVVGSPGGTTAEKADCGDWKNRWSPSVGSCSTGWSDWITAGLIGVAGICVANMMGADVLGGFCGDDDDDKKNNNGYIDPVPTPVTPVTPTTPTNPGPADPLRETTNQNTPVIDSTQPIPTAPR